MDAAGNAGGGLAVWFFPIVSAGRRPAPSCKRKSLSCLIVGRAFVLSGGLIVWGCGCCGAARAGRLCGFGILPNKFLQRKGPCMYRAIACKSSVLYIRLPCLQALGPLQEHTTFRESLVCYTSPPGGVYVLGVLPGVSIIQFVGCRGRSGFALPGPGRPAQSTGLGCPDSQASRARHSHTGLCRSCKAAGYSGVTVRKFQRPALRFPCSGSGSYCSSNAPLFLLVGLCRSLCACIKPWGGPFCKRAERGRRCSGM